MQKPVIPFQEMKAADISDVAWNPGPDPDAVAGLVWLAWPDKAERYRTVDPTNAGMLLVIGVIGACGEMCKTEIVSD